MYTKSVLLFSLFIEHVSLFSQFLIMMSFNKDRNVLKGISNVVEATSKEEDIHGNFGAEIINIIKNENPEWFDEDFNKLVKPDGISIDYDIDPIWARDKLKNVVVQGGLSPYFLLKNEEEMFEAATKYIQIFKDIPYVFNLGHGLLPETDPDKVAKLIKFYRNF